MDLPKTFSLYLKTKGVSPLTLKNYLSDLNHFLGWLELFLRGQNLTCLPAGRPLSVGEPRYLAQYFNRNLVQRYKSYLTSNSLPSSTINRRLSTLRALAKFCLSQAWIKEDPTKQLSNIAIKSGKAGSRFAGQDSHQEKEVREGILGEFQKSLEQEKNSSNTIKSYLSDIREFLNFI